MSAVRQLAAAARSLRKSFENAILSHPIGDVCANRLTGILFEVDRIWIGER
jgi:hypothetical protein